MSSNYEAGPRTARISTGRYAARWGAASRRQREVITAIAQLGGEGVQLSAIARHLGTDSGALSVPRDRLLRSGIIKATEHGLLSFTVPGFTEWVLART
ncbi:MAG: hypothetical protein FWG25_08410 [Promicromonosporaceae bacterium]|nr:hypothetical protein [Promicromonosporaceae bacterium]